MGRQVGFYALDGDHEELLRRCEALGLLALPAWTPADRTPEPVPPALLRSPEPAWSFQLLLPREIDPAAVQYRAMTGKPEVWRLAAERSPVIELEPSRRDRDFVGRGRIYLYWRPRTEGQAITLKRYQTLARFVGRWPKTEKTPVQFHVGPETAARVRAGELCLALNPLELPLERRGSVRLLEP
jgi:hypothetical protein